jgi:hypothetical protein
MQCPSCGLKIDQSTLNQCPRCGRRFTATPGQAPYDNPYPPNPQNPPSSAPVVGQDAKSSYLPAPEYEIQGSPPQGLLAPLPERKRSRIRPVLGVIAVLVLLAACASGTVWALHSQGQSKATNHPGTPAASASPSEILTYGETFTSSAAGWAEDPKHCYLDNDGYHAKNNYICYAPTSAQTDATISVTVQRLSGATTEGYGLAFRLANDDSGSGYRFGIDGESEWVFDKCVNRQCTNLVDFTSNNAIKGGLQSANNLKVTMTGTHFEFFVNDTKVGGADDPTFAAGFVGILGADTGDCVFTDFAVLIPVSN